MKRWKENIWIFLPEHINEERDIFYFLSAIFCVRIGKEFLHCLTKSVREWVYNEYIRKESYIMEQGTIFKFHNDLDTDQIIASQYLLLPNLDEMKGHTFESLDPDFAKKVKPGDFVVGGENFGCGSSREQAPEIIKALGIQCVIAKSFARIFFRNSINNGLLLIEQPTLYDEIKEGDEVTVVLNEHVDYNGKQYPIASLPENLMDIIRAGGLVKAMRKLNGLD